MEHLVSTLAAVSPTAVVMLATAYVFHHYIFPFFLETEKQRQTAVNAQIEREAKLDAWWRLRFQEALADAQATFAEGLRIREKFFDRQVELQNAELDVLKQQLRELNELHKTLHHATVLKLPPASP